jgi:hypothetical protein
VALTVQKRILLLSSRQWQSAEMQLWHQNARKHPAEAPGYAPILKRLGSALSPAQLRHLGNADPSATLALGAAVVCADPAFLQVELHGARAMAIGDIGLDRAQAQALAQHLQPLYQSLGMRLCVHAPNAFTLLLPPGFQQLQAAEPDAIVGMDVKTALPAPIIWQRLLNDTQIELQQWPGNAGRPMPINSLWFWGFGHAEGNLSSLLPLDVESPDPILLGLAHPNLSNRAAPQAAKLFDARWESDVALLLATFKPTEIWAMSGERASIASRFGLARLWRWFSR